MTKPHQPSDEKKNQDPALVDVEPGSDADATPVPKAGETPSNPNGNKSDADTKE